MVKINKKASFKQCFLLKALLRKPIDKTHFYLNRYKYPQQVFDKKLTLSQFCTQSNYQNVCRNEYSGMAIVFCNHKVLVLETKHNEFVFPKGHIEEGETCQITACREMKEETCADVITVEPIALYSISTYGLLCYAEIEELGDMIDSEIEKVDFFDDIPANLTYPDSHALFFDTVKKAKVL